MAALGYLRFGMFVLVTSAWAVAPPSGPPYWIQKAPQTSPSARYFHAMAYDTAHGRVVLFGGYDGNRLSDTWVWDGTNWTQKMPATIPPARYAHGMAYDAAHGQVVMFGGFGASGVLSDTWVWDGNNWAPKTLGPPPAGSLQPRHGVRCGAQPRTLFAAREGILWALKAALLGAVVLSGPMCSARPCSVITQGRTVQG